MSKFLRRSLAALEAYVPGEQPQDRKYIKLNTNESPYPPPQSVAAVLNAEESAKLRLYSDPESRVLKERLANYGRAQAEVFVSNGSDEILNFAFMAYGEQGVRFADITYGFYSVFANLYGLDAEVIPLREDFSLDAEAFCGKDGLTVITNPNAPTGMALPLAAIEEIVSSSRGVVLVDEAYVDFGAESAVNLIDQYDNLLVVQTFSKSRSMAGARLGFAFGTDRGPRKDQIRNESVQYQPSDAGGRRAGAGRGRLFPRELQAHHRNKELRLCGASKARFYRDRLAGEFPVCKERSHRRGDAVSQAQGKGCADPAFYQRTH